MHRNLKAAFFLLAATALWCLLLAAGIHDHNRSDIIIYSLAAAGTLVLSAINFLRYRNSKK